MAYLGFPNEDGLIIEKDKLVEVRRKDSTRIVIPEGVKVVEKQAIDFYDYENCPRYRGEPYYPGSYKYHEFFDEELEIVFPSTIKTIEYNELLLCDSVSYELPEAYLSQKKGLNNDVIQHYLTKNKDVVLDDEVYISLYLYYNFKNMTPLKEIYMPYVIKDPNNTVKVFIKCLSEGKDAKAFLNAAEFACEHKEEISIEVLKELNELCVKLEKKKAIEYFKNVCPEILGNAGVNEMDPLEQYCNEKYDYKEVEKQFKKIGLSTATALKKNPVKYKETGQDVSEYVVRCAMLPYVLLEGKAEILPETDELASHFDMQSFSKFVREACSRAMSTTRGISEAHFGVTKLDKSIVLVGRFSNEDTIQELINGYRKREQYPDERQRKEINAGWANPKNVLKYSEVVKNAILVSDTIAAADFCAERGWLEEYAEIRGVKPEDIIVSQSALSSDEEEIKKAINLYEELILKLRTIMGAEYDEPTIMDSTIKGETARNELAWKFYATIRDMYLSGERNRSNDGVYSPNELYDYWTTKNLSYIMLGEKGISFTVGMLVASYCFGTTPIEGEVLICRDEYELNGDYSESTRVAIKISSKKGWEIYKKKGFPYYEM